MAQKLIVEVIGDASSLTRTFKSTARDAKRFEAQISGIGKSMAKGFALAGVGFFSAQGIVNGLKSSVNAASDLNEQMSKTNAVFGKSADQLVAWSKTTAAAFGISQRQALGTASSFGALFAPLGIVGEQAAQQSRRLTELGADLASFYNTDVQSALDAIRSGIIGESEPLRAYGAQLSEVRVQAEAMAETGKKTAASLTLQEKAAARITLIFKDTAIAQGDVARTQDAFAGQMRKLTAQLDDLQTSLGQALLPAITDVTTKFNEWLADPDNKQKIIDNWAAAVNNLAVAFEALASASGKAANMGSNLAAWWDQIPGPLKFVITHTGPAGSFQYTKSLLQTGLGTPLSTPGPGGFGNIFRQFSGGIHLGGGFGGIFDSILGMVAQIQGAGQTVAAGDAANRTKAAIAQANSSIAAMAAFINKWTAVGKQWEAAQKAAAARRARNQLARQRHQAALENQWGWLEFGLERAQATKTLADDRRILKKQEQWLLNRISHAGRTLELTRKLWRVRDQIRDLNKKKATDGDPLAGLMQVSSKQMAGILAQGTGLSAYGRNILAANIAGQEIHIYNHLDGREVSRSVTRHQAGTAHRTSAQTSGRRG